MEQHQQPKKMSKASAGVQRIFTIPKPKPQPQPQPKPATFPVSIKELANEPDPEKLANTFKQRAAVSVSFRNRHNIYDFTIARLALAKRFSLIEDILESHKDLKEISHEGFAIRIISLYGKAGMFDHARNLFDELPQLDCVRTVKSFNALLKAGVECKRFDEMCTMFRELPSQLSITLNRVSFNTIIHALCERGLLDEGLLMLDELKNKGLSPDVITFNTLLDAFYREKGFHGGERIWAIMVAHNVAPITRSYNLRLQAMVDAGELANAIAFFDSFKKDGLKPDVNTFNALVKGLCDLGDVAEAKKWYDRLLDSEETPNRITFSTLVPRFCDCGDYELAFDLSKKMFSRQIVVDEALLQLVVDGLVKQSMVDEAEELVELGKSNSYVQYSLMMPTNDKLPENGDHSV